MKERKRETDRQTHTHKERERDRQRVRHPALHVEEKYTNIHHNKLRLYDTKKYSANDITYYYLTNFIYEIISKLITLI